jgi:hypothetical protein
VTEPQHQTIPRVAVGPQAHFSSLRSILQPLTFSAALQICCYWSAGATLGNFIAGLLIATLIAPPMILREHRLLWRLLVAGAIIDGIGIVWLAAVITGAITLWQWVQCYLVLAGFVVALLGLVHFAVRVKVPATFASASAVFLGLAWLSWPIWLSHHLTVRSAGILVQISPLFAINRAVINLGIWTERPIAYRLTTLNQNIPYTLPNHIWPCTLAHLVLGVILILLTFSQRAGQTTVHASWG